jgi:hypothetical protein
VDDYSQNGVAAVVFSVQWRFGQVVVADDRLPAACWRCLGIAYRAT